MIKFVYIWIFALFINFGESTSLFRRIFSCFRCCCCAETQEDSPRQRSWSGDSSSQDSTRALADNYGSLLDTEKYTSFVQRRSVTPVPLVVEMPRVARVYYDYEDEVFSKFSNLIEERDTKEMEFAPQISGKYERTQQTRIGTVVLGTLLGSSASSLVYNLDSHPGYVIKFTTDCLELGTSSASQLHPLTRDYLFLSLLSPEGNVAPQEPELYVEELRKRFQKFYKISPRPIFLSPPIPHPTNNRSRKTAFRLNTLRPSGYCVAMNATIRYMIMEKIRGDTVDKFRRGIPDGVMQVSRAIKIGLDVIQVIRFLHDLGIFHNDIHSGNVIPTKEGGVILIDFGRAKLIDEKTRSRIQLRRGGFGSVWSDALNSHWEISGYQQSARDDLYKAMEMMAVGMNGNFFFDSMRDLERRNLMVLHSWKSSQNIFKVFPGETFGARKFAASYERVLNGLGELLDLVRGVRTGNQIDIFDELITQLEKILSFSSSHNL